MTASSICSPVLVNGVTAAARARACGFMVSAPVCQTLARDLQGRPTKQRETRLELATLTLARYRFYSVFGSGRKWPLNDYFPPTSTGIHADHTRSHADPTAVPADHITPPPARGLFDDCGLQAVGWLRARGADPEGSLWSVVEQAGGHV